MAAFDFPNSPSTNDTYTANGVTFQWNGSVWTRYSASQGAQGSTGAQGAQGAVGSPGAQGATGAQGAQGHQGAVGTGAQGSQGHQGVAGSNASISSNANNRIITGGSGTNLVGESLLTFDGTSLTIEDGNEEQILRHWTNSTDSDIYGLLSGSTFGTLHEGAHNGHHVIALRDNDANDSFAIVSGSGNYQTDTTYDKLVARFRSNGNTNIGGTLDVAGSASVSGDLDVSADIRHTGDTDTRLRFETDTISVRTAGDERLRITSTGEVGVGNDSPNCRLAVKDTATHTAYAGVTPSVGNCMLQLYNNPSSEAVNNHSTLQFGVYGGSHNRVNTISAVAESASNRKMAFTFCTDSGANRNERMRITGDGLVGINETSPESQLTVHSTDRHVQQLKSENGVTAGTTSGTIYRQQYTSAGTSRRMGFFGIKRDGGSGDQRASFVMELCPDNSTNLGLASPASNTTPFEFTRNGTIVVKNGGGIDFSATAGPTNGTDTSELLNDYEEGTWTPIFYGASGSEGSFSYGYRHGYYTKIGRLVNVFVNIYTTSIGSYSGNMRIRNFPFSPDTNIESVAATQWNRLPSAGAGSNNQSVFAILQHPNTYCEFRQNHSGTNQFTYMPVQNVTYLRFSMTYMTA